MKLFRITVLHAAPKDTHRSIQGYCCFETDEEVYEYIKSEPLDGMYLGWADQEEDEGGFKDKIVNLRGDINDEDASWDDLYYGRTFYGWEEVCVISVDDRLKLVDLGIIR